MDKNDYNFNDASELKPIFVEVHKKEGFFRRKKNNRLFKQTRRTNMRRKIKCRRKLCLILLWV